MWICVCAHQDSQQQQLLPSSEDNMRAFLGLLVIAVVSGDSEVDVRALLNEDVLLPCSCEDRVLSKELKWQNEKEGVPLLVYSNKHNSPNYADRVETFFNDNSSNCSILLKNVTEDDSGRYTCRFDNSKYQRNTVNLWVYGPKPHQQNFTQPDGVKVFICDVKACDNQTDLQWTLDGEQLRDSSKYQISNSSTLIDGIFNITSTLKINLTETISSSEIKCDVIHSNLCHSGGRKIGGTTASPTEEPPLLKVSSLPKVALLMGLILLAGLCLIVYFRQEWLNRCRNAEQSPSEERMIPEEEPLSSFRDVV
ncbi:uncharacterized protein si:dkey-192g7.3 [Kryptolebias marmoratus]|uniref:uncharacterized protein si:dkey-192g7.3 n=1 Tax=Kryptolebias marmoratus TaxID=37003 RepID=UPI0007F8A723|nr:uncharacterized protein si:dkey-192g7.3 [Kryptolebias marmoratus]